MATGTINTIPDLKDYYFSAPNAIVSRATILNGGYLKFGALVIVHVKIKAVGSASNSPGILRDFPRPRIDAALTAIDITSGMTSAITSGVPCGITDNSNTGFVYIKETTNDHIYAITGCYITAD